MAARVDGASAPADPAAFRVLLSPTLGSAAVRVGISVNRKAVYRVLKQQQWLCINEPPRFDPAHGEGRVTSIT
jgi:hypothetical protein